jgi:hypothetical protein
MMSKGKFYFFTVIRVCLWLACIVLAGVSLNRFLSKFTDNFFVVAIVDFAIMAIFCLGSWIPTFSYKKYSQSKELQDETEFWKSWRKKTERSKPTGQS